MPEGKVGAKKMKKLQEKAEKRRMREVRLTFIVFGIILKGEIFLEGSRLLPFWRLFWPIVTGLAHLIHQKLIRSKSGDI